MIVAQMKALWDDLPPRAIKIGALLQTRVVQTVQSLGHYLSSSNYSDTTTSHNRRPWIVLDPVMISTSGHHLLDEDAMDAMKEYLLSHIDVLTPNKFETEALLNNKLTTPAFVEQAARDIIDKFGVKAILIKGGHSLKEDDDDDNDNDNNDKGGYAQDYFLSSSSSDDDGPLSQPSSNNDDDLAVSRLCDGTHGVWIRNKRCATYYHPQSWRLDSKQKVRNLLSSSCKYCTIHESLLYIYSIV